MYNGINHLAMATSDMDMTIRFWRDLLGLRMVAGFGAPGNRHYFFEIAKNDMIAFFQWPDVKPVEEKEHGRQVKGPFVFDHVSIGVETEDGLWEVKARLEAADMWVSEVIDHGFIHSIYFFDPNGIPVELSHDVEGVDVRKNPVMYDEAPSQTAEEGPEPQEGKWPKRGPVTPAKDRKVYPGAGREYFDKAAGKKNNKGLRPI